MIDALRASTKSLLKQSLDTGTGDWTVQGLGMMRTYLDPERVWRLHVWHGALQVPDVSTIHDHPWDFTSFVISGHLKNQQYLVLPKSHRRRPTSGIAPYHHRTLHCGAACHWVDEEQTCELAPLPPRSMRSGDTYSQFANEIHETMFTNGAVTLTRRSPVGDGNQARIFWPEGTSWVSAEPRKATEVEIATALSTALAYWGR